jgi:hypothetical protein
MYEQGAMKMKKTICAALLAMPLAGCSSAEAEQKTALDACELAFERVVQTNGEREYWIEEKRLEASNALLLVGETRNDETTYVDIVCYFELGREPSERTATYKLVAMELPRDGRIPISEMDRYFDHQGEAGIRASLAERGLDALEPAGSGLSQG